MIIEPLEEVEIAEEEEIKYKLTQLKTPIKLIDRRFLIKKSIFIR